MSVMPDDRYYEALRPKRFDPSSVKVDVQGIQQTSGILALRETTEEMLAEARELRQVIAAASEAERRSTWWMIRLTITLAILTAVLVGLTYVLLADAAGWWPFR